MDTQRSGGAAKSAGPQSHEERKRIRADKLRAKQTAKAEKHARYMAIRRAFVLPDVAGIVGELLARPQGLPLDDYDRRITSQHGEDGITVEVFRRVGVAHRRCVELGCGGNGGNAGVLVAGMGFEGLLLDGNEELVEVAKRLYDDFPAHVEHAWISREKLDELLGAHGFGRDLDYFGVDLDGIDYWVWEALTTQPRVVICEFNPFLGREAAVTIPYRADFSRKARDDAGNRTYPKGYWGASIAAFAALGRRKGYRLVGSAPRSTNAYFVRDDIDADGLPDVSPADAWRPLMKGKGKNPNPRRMDMYDEINRHDVRQHFIDQGFPLVEVH
jgi:hypothetical protein